jgi:hypothetical protein
MARSGFRSITGKGKGSREVAVDSEVVIWRASKTSLGYGTKEESFYYFFFYLSQR